MDAPKCKLCGNAHWGSCLAYKAGPATLDGRTLVHENGQPVIGGDLVAGQEYVVNLTDRQPVLTKAPRGTFDRAAYQREYMRKRRAAAKSAPQ